MSHANAHRAMMKPTERRREGMPHNGVRGTPPEFYAWIDSLLPFTLDVCADESNYKHPRYFDERANGLSQSWAGEVFWCNPVYGRQIGEWLRKGRDECMFGRAFGAFLVPARVDTTWWRTYVMQRDAEAGRLIKSSYDETTGVHWYRWAQLVTGVYFHDQRLKFDTGNPKDTGAPFPSAVIFMGTTDANRPPSTFTGPVDRDLVARWPR